MIDFAPGATGGKVYVVTLVWVASGLVAMVVCALLWAKYRDDLNASVREGASEARQSISRRGIESALTHLLVGLLVTVVGVYSMAMTLTSRISLPPPQVDTILLCLVAIPWVLVVDVLREYRHQLALLALPPPPVVVEPLETQA